MKFEKGVVCNLGTYQSLRLSITDAPSFQACDKLIIEELKRLDIPVNDRIKNVLKWNEHQ